MYEEIIGSILGNSGLNLGVSRFGRGRRPGLPNIANNPMANIIPEIPQMPEIPQILASIIGNSGGGGGGGLPPGLPDIPNIPIGTPEKPPPGMTPRVLRYVPK